MRVELQALVVKYTSLKIETRRIEHCQRLLEGGQASMLTAFVL